MLVFLIPLLPCELESITDEPRQLPWHWSSGVFIFSRFTLLMAFKKQKNSVYLRLKRGGKNKKSIYIINVNMEIYIFTYINIYIYQMWLSSCCLITSLVLRPVANQDDMILWTTRFFFFPLLSNFNAWFPKAAIKKIFRTYFLCSGWLCFTDLKLSLMFAKTKAFLSLFLSTESSFHLFSYFANLLPKVIRIFHVLVHIVSCFGM